jgi:ribosomal protein L18E
VLCVIAADGSILAYVLYEDKSVRRELMKRLTKDEARRIAVNIAKLAELLGAAKNP